MIESWYKTNCDLRRQYSIILTALEELAVIIIRKSQLVFQFTRVTEKSISPTNETSLA